MSYVFTVQKNNVADRIGKEDVDMFKDDLITLFSYNNGNRKINNEKGSMIGS